MWPGARANWTSFGPNFIRGLLANRSTNKPFFLIIWGKKCFLNLPVQHLHSKWSNDNFLQKCHKRPGNDGLFNNKKLDMALWPWDNSLHFYKVISNFLTFSEIFNSKPPLKSLKLMTVALTFHVAGQERWHYLLFWRVLQDCQFSDYPIHWEYLPQTQQEM